MGFERGNLLFTITILFLMVFSLANVIAEKIDISTIDENAVLEETEGITPDNIFYPIDKFFDNFADDVKVRQEAIAEIRAMIEEEKYDDALEALEKYKKHADELEREVSPEQRDEARRSAAAIYNVLKSLEAQIPEEYKGDFFDDIIDKERRIVTAAEIAGRIKALCEELSELDPLQYSRICKTDDDAPRWHRDLDDRLTEEQRQEAEAFFEIMLQCFETSGGTCRCEDISITPFANKCSQIAPLAFACEVEDDEAACDRMDEIEEEEPIEDLLPDYLREVLRDIERQFDEERFEHYGGPDECEGIRDKAECEEIIFRSHAPGECVEELFDNRGLEFDRDYGIGEAQRDCEEIMFDLEAPQECLDAGLTDFRECGILMFSLHAPQECLDAGLTGVNRGDERACRELVGDDFGGRRGPGPIDFNCQEISNPEERLECYDKAASQADSQHGGFDDSNYDGPCLTESDWDVKEQECRELYGEHGGAEPIMGNSGEGYECPIDIKCVDYGQYKEEFKDDAVNPFEGCENILCQAGYYCEYGACHPFEQETEGTFSECSDGCSQECPGASRTECVNEGATCVCFYEEETTTETTSTETTTEESTTDTTTSTGGGTTEPTDNSTSGTGTGGVIFGSDFSGNGFLCYHFNFCR